MDFTSIIFISLHNFIFLSCMKQSSENGIILHFIINKGWLCLSHYFSYLLLRIHHRKEKNNLLSPFFWDIWNWSISFIRQPDSQPLQHWQLIGRWSLKQYKTIAKKAPIDFYCTTCPNSPYSCETSTARCWLSSEVFIFLLSIWTYCSWPI